MSHIRGVGRIDPLVTQSPFYHGFYGRMFRGADAWHPNVPAGMGGLDDYFQIVAAKLLEHDRDTDSWLPAAYTYFGQFIDHDITFDPTSSLMRENDPDRLKNFRTPRLDLDCVYGGGPEMSPHLYEKKSGRFLIGYNTPEGDPVTGPGRNRPGLIPDLPRNEEGTALIGDPRNDENVMVCQIHLSFLKCHNFIYDNLLVERCDRYSEKEAFHEARRILTWLYQYIVWYDFLPRIMFQPAILDELLLPPTVQENGGGHRLNTRFYRWKNSPFMPVEFSVAAYRFGHSLVRNEYGTNNKHDSNPIRLFGSNGPGLGGGRRLSSKFVLQWDWFLEMRRHRLKPTDELRQRARPVDHFLSKSLGHVPIGFGKTASLPYLNLRRSFAMRLPEGPLVSELMCEKVVGGLEDHEHSLWVYLLKEASVRKGDADPATSETGGRNPLGPTGSRIVAEVFAGLLHGDRRSVFRHHSIWRPDHDDALDPALKERFRSEPSSGGSGPLKKRDTVIVDRWNRGVASRLSWKDHRSLRLSHLIWLAGMPIADDDVG